MPPKPTWLSKINEVVRELDSLPRPFVDRATLELLLGVGRRRAQQILAPCTTESIGTSGLVDREALIAHLRRLAAGEDNQHEEHRRERVAGVLQQLRRDRLERPQVLVEAPVAILSQKWVDLPPGVLLEPGRITVSFDHPQQALEKLLALSMAIGNDFPGFERQVAPDPLG